MKTKQIPIPIITRSSHEKQISQQRRYTKQTNFPCINDDVHFDRTNIEQAILVKFKNSLSNNKNQKFTTTTTTIIIFRNKPSIPRSVIHITIFSHEQKTQKAAKHTHLTCYVSASFVCIVFSAFCEKPSQLEGVATPQPSTFLAKRPTANIFSIKQTNDDRSTLLYYIFFHT